MKSETLTCITTVTLFVALAPLQLAAQGQPQGKLQPRYKLVDLGTFGGPNSGVPTAFDELNGTAGAQAISNQGTVAGTADTATADPLCAFDDCFYPNAFQWRNGVLTNLGALPGSPYSGASWISSNGLIAGVSENGQNDPLTGFPVGHAVLWQGGGITDLGTLPGGYNSVAQAVNSRGQVVGLATNGTPDPFSIFYGILGFSTGTQSRAFLWDKQSGMQDLGTLGGPDAWAALINDRGQVAGIADTSFTPNQNNGPSCAPNTPTQEPFFWEKDWMIDMGTFGGTCGIANALNGRGQAAGQSYLADNLTAHAFLWDKTENPQMRDLGTLGGANAGALWLNDAGAVVGYADLPAIPPGCAGVLCVHHGFLWKHGVMTDLGSIGTDPCSRALSINSKGQIVGATAATCGGALTHGFLWENGGPAIDLNKLVAPGSSLSLTTPVYINDRGEIAGIGALADGTSHAFVLIPCGEGDTACQSENSAATAATPRPTTANPVHSGRGLVDRLRARWGKRSD
jgi:probable HAF family extracellular repeat protein